MQRSNELTIISNTDEDKFVIDQYCSFKSIYKKEETLPSSRQKWRNNEVDGRLFCSTKCQKTRAHYQHYVKKSVHALCDITRQAIFHMGRQEKGIHWHARSRKVCYFYNPFRKKIKNHRIWISSKGEKICKINIEYNDCGINYKKPK